MAGVASEAIWRQRVAAWRTSGLRSESFCEAHDFSAALLRHWAWRLGLTRKRKPSVMATAARVAVVPIARVVTLGKVADVVDRPADRSGTGIRFNVGRAVIDVQPGFDAATLAALVDVLERRLDVSAGAR